jgi:hypothetical protein
LIRLLNFTLTVDSAPFNPEIETEGGWRMITWTENELSVQVLDLRFDATLDCSRTLAEDRGGFPNRRH